MTVEEKLMSMSEEYKFSIKKNKENDYSFVIYGIGEEHSRFNNIADVVRLFHGVFNSILPYGIMNAGMNTVFNYKFLCQTIPPSMDRPIKRM